MSEFDIIKNYFVIDSEPQTQVDLGIGDDAALVHLPESHNLVVTTDTIIPGVHIPENCSPEHIAIKALAVNLSDLAAMGANPRWFTLALTIPEENENWLKRFSKTLLQQAAFYNIALIGGDTVKGPLAINIQAMGQIPKNRALTRSNAEKGDLIYVTGTLGDAAFGLSLIKNEHQITNKKDKTYFINRLNCPEPRLGAGLSLRSTATAAIDISDGLISDLSHILDSSGQESDLGAIIQLENIPLSRQLKKYLGEIEAWEIALSGGDDYELCFTVNESNKEVMETSLSNAGVEFQQIGKITGKKGIEFHHGGAVINMNLSGYDHFRKNSKESSVESAL